MKSYARRGEEGMSIKCMADAWGNECQGKMHGAG